MGVTKKYFKHLFICRNGVDYKARFLLYTPLNHYMTQVDREARFARSVPTKKRYCCERSDSYSTINLRNILMDRGQQLFCTR
jgi:hypothetical protein